MKKKREQSPDAAKLRCQAETKLSERKKKAAPPPATESEIRRLVHELQVHQIELEMQNEELMQARTEVETELKKYNDLYDFAPAGYFTLARDGEIRHVNLTGARLLGVERGKLVRRRFGVFVSAESRPVLSAFLDKLFSTSGSKETCEVVILPDGYEPLWAHIEATSSKDGQECHAMVIDITGRKKADEALQESERKLKEAQRLGRIGHWEYDLKTRQINWSDMAFTLYERDPELGPPTEEEETAYYSPEDAERLHNFAERAIKTGEPWEVDISVRLPGERLMSCISIGKSIKDDQGQVIKLYGTIQDNTERKRAEKLLREKEAQLSNAMEIAKLGYWEYDVADDRFTFNDHFYAIFRISAEKAGGYKMSSAQYAEQFLHPDDRAVVGIETRKAIETTDPHFTRQLEHRIIYADGEIGYISVRFFIVKDEKGRTIKTYGANQDITERKRAEQERERLIKVIEQTDDLIIIMDKNGVILYANPAFEVITGYTNVETIGKTIQFLAGPDNAVLFKEIWDKLNNGIKWSGRLHAKRKDGGNYILDSIISPVLDEAGTITSYTAVMRDVTNNVLIEQRLRESQKLGAIGTLAGGIAHDFNNILAGIIGYTELSLDAVPEGSQIHSDLTKIFKAGYRARDLVNQILTFSRQREQEKRPITIVPIIKESLKLLRSSLPSTVEIRQNIEPEPGIIMADPTRIHQVIMNLCTNAGHAMREKGGILEVSLTSKELDSEFCLRHPGLVPGSYLELRVSDTGHGIAPDILSRIFEPYFTTGDKSGGTGLGLSVVHGIVTDCGGTVTVYSDPGKGTTFKMYLPTTTEEAVAEIEETPSVTKGHERILLIDDEPDIIDVGKRILEQLGYTVTSNSSSMDALEIFQKDPHQFDLVISDMTMPFMTGDELAGEFMQIRQDIPIIICTGYSEKLTEEKALSIGIRAYLGKPLLKYEIAETVRRVLDQKSEDA